MPCDAMCVCSGFLHGDVRLQNFVLSGDDGPRRLLLIDLENSRRVTGAAKEKTTEMRTAARLLRERRLWLSCCTPWADLCLLCRIAME